MVDPETGRRSVPMQEEERAAPTDYVGAASEVGGKAVDRIGVADKGWVLGTVVLIITSMALLEITNYLENSHRAAEASKYLIVLEENRAAEVRRAQESSRLLAQALARTSDRKSREVQQSQARATDFVGPPAP